GAFDGVVTAPVQKSVINDAGEPFTGHTELFAQRAGCEVVMMLASPELRVAVLGLNPHAGEGGHLGREEIDTIIPALDALRSEGMQLLGPLPADTAFV